MYIGKAETERLQIRELKTSDIPDWETFFENNPLLGYLGFDINKDKHTLSKEWIEIQLQRYNDNRYGHHALIEKTTGKFIGQCGLLAQKLEEKDAIEIGYHIIPEYWGNGFATEAASFFKNFAFKNKITDELISIIDIRNIASQKVAEKNGMKIAKKTKLFNLDVYIFKIDRTDWVSLPDIS